VKLCRKKARSLFDFVRKWCFAVLCSETILVLAMAGMKEKCTRRALRNDLHVPTLLPSIDQRLCLKFPVESQLAENSGEILRRSVLFYQVDGGIG
jgi:hypothetical protein